jgi:ABC-type multidrug transport system fused ATPase/permease subunit
MIVYVAFLSSSPYFYKLLIDSLESNLSQKIFDGRMLFLILIWLFVIIGTIAMRYLYGMVLLETVQKDWFAFLIRSMKMMLRLPIDYHISIQHGEKQKLIDRASEAVWEMGDNGMLHIIPQILVTIILILSGILIDPVMTGISLILLPIAIYGIRAL